MYYWKNIELKTRKKYQILVTVRCTIANRSLFYPVTFPLLADTFVSTTTITMITITKTAANKNNCNNKNFIDVVNKDKQSLLDLQQRVDVLFSPPTTSSRATPRHWQIRFRQHPNSKWFQKFFLRLSKSMSRRRESSKEVEVKTGRATKNVLKKKVMLPSDFKQQILCRHRLRNVSQKEKIRANLFILMNSVWFQNALFSIYSA